MAKFLIVLPLLLGSASAVAAAPPAKATPPAAPPSPAIVQQQVQRALTDPAMVDRLGNAAQALTNVLLDLPVGQLQAAVEGRKPTAAEAKQTLRDLGRRDDPNFERNLRQQIAQSKPMIERSMKALGESLPAMMEGLQRAQQSVERAAANMPDPTYPKR